VSTISPHILRDCSPNVHPTFITQHGRNRGAKLPSPISNIFIHSADIRRRTSKSFEIGPNFASFWLFKFFGKGPQNFRPAL